MYQHLLKSVESGFVEHLLLVPAFYLCPTENWFGLPEGASRAGKQMDVGSVLVCPAGKVLG